MSLMDHTIAGSRCPLVTLEIRNSFSYYRGHISLVKEIPQQVLLHTQKAPRLLTHNRIRSKSIFDDISLALSFFFIKYKRLSLLPNECAANGKNSTPPVVAFFLKSFSSYGGYTIHRIYIWIAQRTKCSTLFLSRGSDLKSGPSAWMFFWALFDWQFKMCILCTPFYLNLNVGLFSKIGCGIRNIASGILHSHVLDIFDMHQSPGIIGFHHSCIESSPPPPSGCLKWSNLNIQNFVDRFVEHTHIKPNEVNVYRLKKRNAPP